jgi:hypothetical protein
VRLLCGGVPVPAVATSARKPTAASGRARDLGKRYLNLTIKTVSRSQGLGTDHAPRRHARDYERLIQHSDTLITWAALTLMPRRLTRSVACPR